MITWVWFKTKENCTDFISNRKLSTNSVAISHHQISAASLEK